MKVKINLQICRIRNLPVYNNKQTHTYGSTATEPYHSKYGSRGQRAVNLGNIHKLA